MKNSFVFLLFLAACSSEITVPKPKTYPRITLPIAQYQSFDTSCPFVLKVNTLARIRKPERKSEPCWWNVEYMPLNAIIYLSYKPVQGDIAKYLEEARSLVYNHTVKASYIEEISWNDSLQTIFSMQYYLSGNTATALQFYATDQKTHFLRGSLYFNQAPNEDSLKPVIAYLQKDVEHLIKTLQWK